MYGTPMIDAQAMPRPMIGRNSRSLLVMWGKISRPTAAHSRQPVCTHFAPRRRAIETSEKATQKGTMLYQPLTSPVHETASWYRGSSADVTPNTDWAIERDTNCQ